MENRESKIADEIESICDKNNWVFERTSGENGPLPLSLTNGETDISVHKSLVTDGRLICVEKVEEDSRSNVQMEKFGTGDAVVKRVKLWIE